MSGLATTSRIPIPRLRAGELSSFLAPLTLAIIAAAGLALRLDRAWEGMRDLVTRTTPDDAYYYFQIAHNITHGNGATLDGETVTSGFHPLWLFIILPLFGFSDRELSVHLALTLCALLSTATIIVVYHIVVRLAANQRAALVAAGLFSFHPVIIVNGINGLETALMLCMLSLVILVFVDIWQKPRIDSWRPFALLGVLGGMMILSRTDTSFAFACMVAALIIRGHGSMRWRGPLAAGGIALACVLPWVLWCLVATGRPLQDSAIAGGQVIKNVRWANHEDSFWPNLSYGWDILRDAFEHRLAYQFFVPVPDDTTPYWLAAGAAVLAILLIPVSGRRSTVRSLGVVTVPFVGFVLVLAVSAAFRWYVAHWYYAPFGLLLAIWMGLLGNYVEGLARDAHSWLGGHVRALQERAILPLMHAGLYSVMVLALAGHFAGGNFRSIWYSQWWQGDQYDAALWIGQNTPDDARVGAFNAGIPAWFSGRMVMNLDGVMNYDAYEALRDCDTRTYVRDSRLDYISDSDTAFILVSCGLGPEDLTLEHTVGAVRINRTNIGASAPEP